MGRNEVADVVNELVGAGMELKQAMEFAPVAAKFVVGQGSSGVDTAKMIQALQSNANITDPKVLEKALEAVAFQGQAGSFEASDMARWLLLLTCGCQFNLPPQPPQPQLVVTQCKPPPAPAAWFMAPIEPNLTQRMLNELSESPATATKD